MIWARRCLCSTTGTAQASGHCWLLPPPPFFLLHVSALLSHRVLASQAAGYPARHLALFEASLSSTAGDTGHWSLSAQPCWPGHQPSCAVPASSQPGCRPDVSWAQNSRARRGLERALVQPPAQGRSLSPLLPGKQTHPVQLSRPPHGLLAPSAPERFLGEVLSG